MPLDMILLLPVAFLIGTIAAMTGVGGGVFIVPLLFLVPPYNSIGIEKAVGTSLATIIFTSLSSTLGYSRQRRIDYKVGLILTLTTIPGAFVGAYLTSFITQKLLGLIFGIFLIFVALRMIFKLDFYRFSIPRMRKGWRRKIMDSDGTLFEYDVNVNQGLVLSFFGGLSSGLLGIGGGALMVPILHLMMNFPMHITVATSMFIMIFTSISGATTHFSLGNVRADYAIFLSIGVIFGAQFGAYLSKRISGKNLRRIFGVVLLLISIRMILEYIFVYS